MHDAALLGVPVDTVRLYEDDDGYAQWIEAIVARVYATRDRVSREK